MKTKQEILDELRAELAAGTVSEADVRSVLSNETIGVAAAHEGHVQEKKNLSAVEIMFYISGVVFYVAIVSAISVSWNDGGVLMHTLLSAGIGSLLWGVAYYLLRQQVVMNGIRVGLTNALLLTGSLLLTTGGYIIANETVDGYGEVTFIPMAIALFVLAGMHVGFDKLVRRKLILFMGIFLGVSGFTSFMFGILREGNAPIDLWTLVLLVSAGLLAYATRVAAKLLPNREGISGSFDGFAVFVGFFSMYAASFGDNSILWYIAVAAAVIGTFYLSILRQSKQLLGSASFFLIVTIITISLRYFSGYGITSSLMIATVTLLGTAAVASTINKKYFK